MGWENQYIEMLGTKPGIIFGDREHDLSQEMRQAIADRVAQYDRLYVEIGSGSGMHLLRLAELSPSALCVGFEIRFKRAFKTGEKADRRGIDNLAVLRTDGRHISSLFSPGQVDAFFVNYPDPWDKRRWLKNRLLNEEMIDTMWSLLKNGGFLRYKTDHPGYFESTVKLLENKPWKIRKLTTDLLESPYIQDNIPTEFEQLWRFQKKPLALLEAHKKEIP